MTGGGPPDDPAPRPGTDADASAAAGPGEGETVGSSADPYAAVPDAVMRYRVPIGLVLLVVVLRPLVAQDLLLGFGAIASTMLIWMIFVASVNLLFGFTGLLSFGHAMFLGMGLYGAAIGVSQFGLPYLVAAPAGIAFAAGFAYLLGRFTVQKGEIYFAMLTLAVGKAIEFVVNKDPAGLTGGSNGLTQGTLPPWIESFRGEKFVAVPVVRLPVDLAVGPVVDRFDWYFAVAAVFLVAMLLLWQVLRSPFGRSLVAIRENEDLARAMGVDAKRYKTASMTMSGALAALAGAVLEINNHGASIELLSVITSGDAVLMAVLGGVNFFAGPIAGAFVWLFAEEFLTDLSGIFTYWHFFVGALIVSIVVVSPKNGVWGGLKALSRRIARRIRDRRSGGGAA